MTSATPYLTVHDAARAIEFYAAAFGATASDRYDDGGRIGHVSLAIGDATVYVSDEYPEVGAVSPQRLGGATSAVVLSVDDAEAAYAAAVAAGATADRPVRDDVGGRSGWLVDPFGHRWNIRTAG